MSPSQREFVERLFPGVDHALLTGLVARVTRLQLIEVGAVVDLNLNRQAAMCIERGVLESVEFTNGVWEAFAHGTPGTVFNTDGMRRKLKGPCLCRVAKQSTLMLLSADDLEAELKVNQPLAEALGARRQAMAVSAREYPSPETWQHATSRQVQRAARSFAALKQREVPVYSGPLFVDDDERAKAQAAPDVARRLLVLWAVELRAEGCPQGEAVGLIDHLDLWSSVSSSEKAFLENENPDPADCRRLVWRLESIWVLLWALGYVEELDWPSGMCDVPSLVKLVNPNERDPAFITTARLRPISELLDAQDLIMRIRWAIRDASLNHGGRIPSGLDWSVDGDCASVTMSDAVGVVEQRHHTLNWLVNFLDPEDWDHVDTPT